MDGVLERLLESYPDLAGNVPEIRKAYETIVDCYDSKGKLLLCGNGGSASDCDHIAGELLKGFMQKRRLPGELRDEFVKYGADETFADNLQGALAAVSLVSQTAFSTAFLNDVNPWFVYAQQVYALGKEKDVFIGISTSGNSENVINAAIVAKQKKMKVIVLTGENGGKLGEISDIAIKVPARETYRVQEYHVPVYHALCEMIERHYWKDKMTSSC